MNILYDPQYNWSHVEEDEYSLLFKGSEHFARQILKTIKNSASSQGLKTSLSTIKSYSSGIIESDSYIIAWVDHIRAWPVYYTQDGANFYISPNAHMVQEEADLQDINDLSSLEFAMAGYVTGKHTLYKDLYALQPGEFLMWDKKRKKFHVERYYQYSPTYSNQESDTVLIDQLNMVFDKIIQRIIDRVHDRPIWVPLSGGLDSRIILCKLHEHGYKNIHTFTYGPCFNFEAKIAKKIAGELDVPWTFVTIPKKQAREEFESQDRKDFWTFADGFKAISSMREYIAVKYLYAKGLIADDAILINGQSGDYISGGHISSVWTNKTPLNMDYFYNQILKKHYGLWPYMLNEINKEVIKKRIDEVIGVHKSQNNRPAEYAKMEEIWEYDARQISLVIHGNRNYDFLNLSWELPLWDKEIVDFFEDISLEKKQGQYIFKKWLQHYNYEGLFPEKEPYIWRWPLPMLWVLPVAKIISLIKGQEAKTDFYARMRYFGHYSNQFQFYKWNEYKKVATCSRNIISLYVRTWFKENPKFLNDKIKEGLSL